MSINDLPSQGMAEEVAASQRSDSGKKHRSKDGKKRKRDPGVDTTPSPSKKSRKDRPIEEQPQSPIEFEQNYATSSPFHTITSSLYLPLAPISQRTPLEGMCAEHLSPLILTYYPPFNGVLLSYSNPRLSETPQSEDEEDEILLNCIDEYAASWAWVTADFLVFKPERGGMLEGYVNLQNEGHLGLVCWNLFNASIERKRLPSSWKWLRPGVSDEADDDASEAEEYAEDGIGRFVDGNGNEITGLIRFRVKNIESSHDRERGFMSIEGTMLNEEDESKLLQEEEEQYKRKGAASRRVREAKTLSSTSLGVPIEPGMNEQDDWRSRNRRSL